MNNRFDKNFITETKISFPADFNFKKQCASCYTKLAAFDKIKIADNMYICRKCLSECSKELLHNTDKKNIADIKNSMYRMSLYPEFVATHQFGELMFDTKNKLWKQDGYPIFKFSDILNFEVVDERNSTTTTTTQQQSKTSGGKGNALVGGLLFGNVGAVVGGITGKRKQVTTGSSNTSTYDVIVNLGIRIAINDLDNPSVFISFIDHPISVSSSRNVVEQLNKAVSFLNIILEKQSNNITGIVQSKIIEDSQNAENNEIISTSSPYTYSNNNSTQKYTKHKKQSVKQNTPSKISAVICFIYAAICTIMSFSDLVVLPMTLFFAILGVMFLLLHFTPKESEYVLDKFPIRRKPFVISCLIINFIITAILINLIK